MIAIINHSGRQLKVLKDQNIDLDKLSHEVGHEFEIPAIFVADKDNMYCDGGKYIVSCKVVSHIRDKKVVVFKNRRRSTFRKKKGHVQSYTKVQILDIKLIK